MKLFDVYPLFPIEPVKATGAYVYDKHGTEYLDFRAFTPNLCREN